MRSAVDSFYESPENRPIQIAYAVQVVQLKVSGVQQTKIDDFVAGIRRDAVKLSNSGEVVP